MERRTFLKAFGGAVALQGVGLPLTGMAATANGDLNWGTLLAPKTMDPHFSSVFASVYTQCNVYEALVRWNDSVTEIVPVLAESWKVLDSTRWEFTLREGVRFHDGTELTAKDVAASYERVPRFSTQINPFVSQTKGIKSIEVVDDRTLVFTTVAPNPDLLLNLLTIYIVPARHLESSTQDFDSGKAAIGTGPYKYAEFVPGELMQLDRFEDYWGARPEWPRATYRVTPNDAARTAALLSGGVDLIDNVNIADLPKLREESNVEVVENNGIRAMFAFVDQDRETSPFAAGPNGENPLRDVRVRKALSLGVDRAAIVDRILNGSGVPSGQMAPPGRLGVSPLLGVPEYDPVAAKQLLKEAGYEDGFSLTLHGTADSYPGGDRVAQAIAQYYSRLGIKMEVALEVTSQTYGRLVRREFSLMFIGFGGLDSMAYLRTLTHSANKDAGWGALNKGGYSNAEVDELIEAAAVEFDRDKREKLFQKAFEISIGQDQAFIPYYNPIENYAVRKDRVQFSPNARGKLYFDLVRSA